jgi:hypothetical protein
LGYSEPSSPDFYNGNGYFSDTSIQQSQASFPLMNNGPPPAVAPYNPQYTDPSSASMESLQRTLAAAQAASEHDEFNGFLDTHESIAAFGSTLCHDSSSGDRAQFPSEDSLAQFNNNQPYSYPSSFSSNLYTGSHSMPDLQHSPEEMTSQTPTPFSTYPTSSGSEAGAPQMTTFPSQLLPSHDGLPSHASDTSESQSPEESSNGSNFARGFKYDDIPESDESSNSPPGPSIPFKSPPPPMDIASRRKKVQVKPAALVSETLRSRPSMGPRTVSHAEGFRRPSDSPISSPMRRIVSAGGNRNVISGRVIKSGVESAQRSPINLGGFGDAGSFLEHNYHNLRNPPSLTAGSSLSSSLAPPTPMSPREREMTFAKRENPRSTASPVEGGMNYVFNAGVPGCFTSVEGDQNLASPPETPQAQMAIHSSGNGWPTAVEFHDKQWHFEVPDEPLYTPAHDTFNLELQMPQPTYLSSLSQPVTPAFGQFNQNFIFGHESPQYKNESPQYMLSTHAHSEYAFPEAHPHYPMGMLTSPMTKQKTFQFSHTTAADFSEK